MSEPIFREKSLEKVKSPDNLNEYIRVSNPGVWLLLAAIIALLLGFCIWGIFGQVRTVVQADVHCEQGTVVCHIPDSAAGQVRPGMTIIIEGHKGTIAEIELRANGQTTCTITMNEPLEDGIYDGTIEIESLRPITFLLN